MKTVNGQQKQDLIRGSRVSNILTIGLLFCSLTTLGQVPIPQPPTPATFQPVISGQSSQKPNNNYQPNYPKSNGLDQYEKDHQRQIEQQRQLNEIYWEIEESNRTSVKYDLPSCSSFQGTEAYRSAFSEILKMTSGERKFNIKEANFLVENAYFENKANYDAFNKTIGQITEFLTIKMKDFGYNPNSNLAKNILLYRFFSDTLEIKSKNLIHYPIKYDFEDYLGKEDWTKMFVIKTLATNSGQCHSLPLLYLILADEIGAKAQLSFSPSHTYIKFQDDNGKWYNVELTNGMFTTDAFVLQSGYIKSEAVSNKIYMQPLKENQLLAHVLYDLAKGYASKYCYDSFVESVINKAIELDPNNINAQMVLSDYRTMRFQYVISQIKEPPQQIHKYPRAKALLDEMYAQYDVLDNLGFEDMPEAEYEKWLNSLNDAKQKQQSQELFQGLNQKIKIQNIELKK